MRFCHLKQMLAGTVGAAVVLAVLTLAFLTPGVGQALMTSDPAIIAAQSESPSSASKVDEVVLLQNWGFTTNCANGGTAGSPFVPGSRPCR